MPSFIVVDDFTLQGPILQKLLKRLNCDFTYLGQGYNGPEGVELAERTRPDLIFMDIEMPAMDGFSVIRRIRTVHPGAQSIILSAHDDFLYTRQAVQMQIIDYLLKPVSEKELEKGIGRFLAAQAAAPAISAGTVGLDLIGNISCAVLCGDVTSLEQLLEKVRSQCCSQSQPASVNGYLLTLVAMIAEKLSEQSTSPETIQSIFEQFTREFRINMPLEARIQALLQTLLSLSVFFQARNHKDSCTYILRAKDWTMQHLNQEITLQRLADELFISPPHLSRLFKQQEGITFSEYLLQKRLDLACSLLLTSQDPIEVIALKCGYTKGNSFWKMFKKRMGVSPGQYRENH